MEPRPSPPGLSFTISKGALGLCERSMPCMSSKSRLPQKGYGKRLLNAFIIRFFPPADGLRRSGPTVVQRQAAIQQNAYQQSLDEGLVPPELTTESVRYWSDFNRVYYHPRSITQLNEYELNSSLMPFEHWSTGEELFNTLDKEHDLLDRDLRSFVEEADQMQGIQVIAGIDDAWGGFAARYMDRLRDEYGKTAIWVWGLEDGIKTVSRVCHLNTTKRLLALISRRRKDFLNCPTLPNPSPILFHKHHSSCL